jgi:hypothetical protein
VDVRRIMVLVSDTSSSERVDRPSVVAKRLEVFGCQWPFVSPRRRPSFLPADGHVFSPLVATNVPTHTG